MFLVEDLVLGGYYFEVGDGNKLDRGWNTPWFSFCEIFTCTGRFWNFWPFFLYLDTGRLVGELEMNICISLARARENKLG